MDTNTNTNTNTNEQSIPIERFPVRMVSGDDDDQYRDRMFACM